LYRYFVDFVDFSSLA
jgi:hypothetical protein